MDTLVENIQLIQSLYQDIDGMSISLNGRKGFNYDRVGDLTYGELTITELVHIFSSMDLTRDMHFIDLGSGTGKITLFVSILYPFLSFQGIEIVSSLHDVAKSKLEEFQTKREKKDPIKFKNLNFLSMKFPEDRYCFYTNCLCFSDKTCQQMESVIEKALTGSYLFSTKEISLSSKFIKENVIENCSVSWGENSIFIYKKIN